MIPGTLLFEGFELRLDSGELLRDGSPVKLQLRPARVLALLALRAGAAVSREEIRREVWGEEHVDFDLALNYCIRQIRRALGDSAERPRFVETLPRVGYRFLPPVEVRHGELRDSPPPLPPPRPAPPRPWESSRRLAVTALLLLLSLAGLIALRSQGAEPELGRRQGMPILKGAAAQLPQEALRAYLEGQYFDSRGEPEKARNAFQKAVTLAPGYAPAWAALARELLALERPAREVEPLVEAAEQRTLALDPDLALAHLVRAKRLAQYEYDWQGSERELRKALDLDPQQAETHAEYAMLLAARGRSQEALGQVHWALYLKPEQQLVSARYPWFYYLDRRYDKAIEHARRQIELATGKTSETNPTQPDLFWAFRTITLASLAKGDREGALAAARDEARWLGDPEPSSLHEFWATKERMFAKVGPNRPWFGVVPAIELGDRERALDLLLAQCRERSDPMIAYLKVDPLYDSLRSQPRFRELLRCANLEDGPG